DLSRGPAPARGRRQEGEEGSPTHPPVQGRSAVWRALPVPPTSTVRAADPVGRDRIPMGATGGKAAEALPKEGLFPTAPEGDSAPGGADEQPVTIIERKTGWGLLDLGELWRYRELLVFLIWRDVTVRYKQTVLGASWAVLQPFATM